MLGATALALGDFEAARSHLLSALDNGPVDGLRLYRLAQTRSYVRNDAADADRFAKAWADFGLPEAHRELAGFALAKLMVDLGRLDEAAVVLRAANRLAHFHPPWSRAEWIKFVDASLSAVPVRPRHTDDQPPCPLFIVGLPRTGTTLLAELLGRDPRICNRGELNWISHLWHTIGAPPWAATALADAARLFWTHVLRDQPLRACYIDKNPLNFRYLPLIQAMLPNARVIHCVRDARDVALSLFSLRFASDENAYAYDFGDIADFMAGSAAIARDWPRTITLPLLEVRYENLVSQTKQVIATVKQFAGLRDEGAADVARPGSVGTASVWQVRQPVYQTSSGRWQSFIPHFPELSLFGQFNEGR